MVMRWYNEKMMLILMLYTKLTLQVRCELGKRLCEKNDAL